MKPRFLLTGAAVLCALLAFSCNLALEPGSPDSAETAAARALPTSFGAYLMVHFTGESTLGEQTYFSVSTDGLHWTDLNNSSPVLISNVGTKGVRDHSIIRKQDGTFVMMATDLRMASGGGWTAAANAGSTKMVIWTSSDLVNWSAPRLVEFAASITGAGCAWAPAMIYDEEKLNYFICWATISPVNGVNEARIYYSTTTDFVTFSAPKLWIENTGTGDIIDTQIIKVTGANYKYYRVSKTTQIVTEGSNTLLGTWTHVGDLSSYGLTAAQVEGPIIYKFNNVNQWCLLVDQHATGKGYLPLVTSSLNTTTGYRVLGTTEYSLGNDLKRHGEVINITTAEYNALMAKWPNVVTNTIQSYNFPTMNIRHANWIARIDPNVSPVADSQFKLVPGLANNSGYVSFQSVNFPGYYLRHSNYKLVLAPDDGSATFKADATFKRVAGLADAAWSSFQSYNFPTRYIRHYNYVLQIDPITTAIEQQDGTFKVN